MFEKNFSFYIRADVQIGTFVSLAVLFLFILDKPLCVGVIAGLISLIWLCVLVKNKKKIVAVRLFVCMVSFLIWLLFYINLNISQEPIILLKNKDITHLNGTLVKDSINTTKGRVIYTIKLESAENRNIGLSTEAHGIVSVSMSSLGDALITGEKIGFNVSGYRNNLYYATGMQRIKEPSAVVKIRKAILLDIYDRMRVLYKTDTSESAYYSRNLATMLLLSRGDSNDEVKNEAAKVGVAHVFALSGAHLVLIATFFSFVLSLFLPPFVVSKINCLILGIYVFIIGPSPSLVRSYFMYFLRVNFKNIKPYVLYLTVILQTLFYPYTITSISFKLSYVCVCSLVVFNSLISYSITFRFFKRFSMLLSTGLTAIIFSSPISIKSFGTWSPYGLILSPLIMFFAVVCMIGGVFNLMFCPSRIGNFLMKNSYVAIRFILDTFNKNSLHFSWGSYYVLLLIAVLMFALKTFLYKKRLRC